MMKVAKSITSFLLVLAVLALLITTIFTGASFGFVQIPKVVDQGAITGVRQGYDLVGGTEIVYKAVANEGVSKATSEIDMGRMADMFDNRIMRVLGSADGYAQRIGSTDMVRVNIPYYKLTDEQIAGLGMASLTTLEDADGNVILSGSDIIASWMNGPVNQGGEDVYFVAIQIQESAREALRLATMELAGKVAEGKNTMTLKLDGQDVLNSSVSAEYVTSGMDTTQLNVPVGSGENAKTYASYTAKSIVSGTTQLVYTAKQVSYSELMFAGNLFRNTVLAGIIGIALVALYLLIVYRAPGFVALVGLGIYACALAVIMATWHINIGQAGILAIILSGGMLILSNIMIFERTKAEIRSGKSVGSSVDFAYKSAIKTVFDMHVIAIVSAFVLMFLANGAMKEFAVLMLWGAVLSLFIVIISTGLLLKGLAGLKIKSPSAYGV